MDFVADENFDGNIIRGLLERIPELDIIRAQDTKMYQAPDPQLLEWAAQQKRILLTHDIKTMPKHAYDRIDAGKSMPGIIAVHQNTSIGKAIEDLELLIGGSLSGELENQVKFVPLQ